MEQNRRMRMGSRGGSAERFEQLYATYHAQVFGYVLRRCERAEDAGDAIAETFLVVWRRLEDLPPEEEVRPWLYGIARRVLANQRRGARRRSALAERLSADLLREPMPVAVSVEAADGADLLLEHALNGLSEEDREILKLEAWEGLAPSEIAVVLGCSQGAARTRLHRARQRLRDQIHRSSQADFDPVLKPDATGGHI